MASSFFEEASDELISWLSEKGATQQYEVDSILIKEGVISEHVFILINGEILVKTTNQNGIQQRLAVLNSGAIIGEMSWLEQRPAVADIVTNSKSKVLCTLFKQPLENSQILAGIFLKNGEILELFESK